MSCLNGMDWRIGCSGFYYKEWKEIFYPKGLAQKNWFPFYGRHFNTIEINSTFYRMPTAHAFAKWYVESPPDFLFTIKAPRLITHYKQLNDCQSLLNDFYEAVHQGLKEKLGCVLFQFPPKFDFTEQRLLLLLELLHPAFTNVVEFRHASWWQATVYEQLASRSIIFSGQSYPSQLPEELVKNNAILYYRFHGKPILYKSTYPLTAIEKLVEQMPPTTERAFIYFNNTWGNGALTNAKQLQKLTHSLPTLAIS